MKSRGVRVLLLMVAVAALAAAGTGVWQLEQRLDAARSRAETFERDAREVVVSLGDWRAAQQAYVAEGQPSQAWMAKTATIAEALGPRLAALRGVAKSAEAQASLESAVEAVTAFLQSDARARDYAKSGQLLSASDVIFVESAPAIEKAVIGVDTARGQESVAWAVELETLRRWELILVGGAAAIALIVMLLLLPIPRAAERSAESADDDAVVIPKAAGLNLSQDFGDGVVSAARPMESAFAKAPAQKDDALGAIDAALEATAQAMGPDLDAVADLCAALARVQDTQELPGLLERVAKALDATGVIIWMPDGPQGTLRPVLAHGYASLALSRMGIINPAADNATATAYRTRSAVVVPSDIVASGAVVAPLVSSEGCSGAMAVELRGGVEPTPRVKAVATILAAQLATMFTPGEAAAPQPQAAAGPGRGV